MSFWTGVKVVIATLLAVASMGMLWLLEMVLTGHAGFRAVGSTAYVPIPGAGVLAWLAPVGGAAILWYGLFGPGFFGADKKTR